MRGARSHRRRKASRQASPSHCVEHPHGALWTEKIFLHVAEEEPENRIPFAHSVTDISVPRISMSSGMLCTARSTAKKFTRPFVVPEPATGWEYALLHIRLSLASPQ